MDASFPVALNSQRPMPHNYSVKFVYIVCNNNCNVKFTMQHAIGFRLPVIIPMIIWMYYDLIYICQTFHEQRLYIDSSINRAASFVP